MFAKGRAYSCHIVRPHFLVWSISPRLFKLSYQLETSQVERSYSGEVQCTRTKTLCFIIFWSYCPLILVSCREHKSKTIQATDLKLHRQIDLTMKIHNHNCLLSYVVTALLFFFLVLSIAHNGKGHVIWSQWPLSQGHGRPFSLHTKNLYRMLKNRHPADGSACIQWVLAGPCCRGFNTT